MTHKTRKILFYASFTAFLILSALILIAALGFSYDFRSNNFVKTGSILLVVNKQADVFISDKSEGRTSFIGNSFSKKRLLPGEYEVRIQQEGFKIWQKKIEVREGLVTSFGNIILLGEEPKEEIFMSADDLAKYKDTRKHWDRISLSGMLNENLENIVNIKTLTMNSKLFKIDGGNLFWLDDSDNQIYRSDFLGNAKKKIAGMQLPEGKIVDFSVSSDESAVAWATDHEVWIMWMKDSDYQPAKKAGEKELITRLSENIKSIDWRKSGGYVFLRLENKFSMLETDIRGGINLNSIFDSLEIGDVIWYDSGFDKIFKLQNDSLMSVKI